MPEGIDAPWYDELTDTEKVSYLESANELVTDLRCAAGFFDSVDNKVALPVRSYQPDVSVHYFVQDTDEDPKGLFARIERHVVERGGRAYERRTRDGSVQHFAELRFGSGRVSYRATWIERGTANSKKDERNI